MRDSAERLRDILEAIAAIERYLDRGKAAFQQDELLQGWFVRNLQILGEAARALPGTSGPPLPRCHGRKSLECETSSCTAIST